MIARSSSKIEGLQEVQDILKEYREGGALELKQYREIGTIDEFRKANEKQKQKKPKPNKLGSLYCQCPNCLSSLLFEDNDFSKNNYCSNCGQAIDWDEE